MNTNQSRRRWILAAVIALVALNSEHGEAFTPHHLIKRSNNKVHVWGTRKHATILGVSRSEIEDSNITRQEPGRKRKRNVFQDSILRLAELSLADFEWRNSVFKTNEADRKVEESIARMMGEDPSYVRPMDASENTIGPLGRAEKSAVEWLSRVIDEEGRRAQKIVNSDGALVRPIDAAGAEDELGPLGTVEKQVVDFLQSIRESEMYRVSTNMFARPKDLEESVRGPLGDLELSIVSALEKIQQSELLRMQQSRVRGGEIVRPIDIPGPLGEFEMAVIGIMDSEEKRTREGGGAGNFLRPKDATNKGALGQMELQAVEIVERLTSEEKERLRNMQRVLEENRPMETNKNSVLGLTEAVAVGILRAPQMLFSVYERVSELMKSEELSEKDLAYVKEQEKKSSSSSSSPSSSSWA